jgi:hypothetical protein
MKNQRAQLFAAMALLGDDSDDFTLSGDEFEVGDDIDEIVGDDLDDALGDDDDDTLGDDEILGAVLGGYDVLGADMILGGTSKARKRALARKVMAKNAVALQRRKPSGAQEQVLGFERATVTALTEATVRAFPQRKFRTERLTIAASIANFFDVLDLRVGRDSLFVDVGPVPAEMFSQVGVGTALRGYTANLGNTITLQVENIDAGDQPIRAGIRGTAVTY